MKINLDFINIPNDPRPVSRTLAFKISPFSFSLSPQKPLALTLIISLTLLYSASICARMDNIEILLVMVFVVTSVYVGETSQKRARPLQRNAATIPDNLLGSFTNNKDKLNHVTALWFLLHDAPSTLDVNLNKGNTFEFKRWEPPGPVLESPRFQQSNKEFDYQYCYNFGESPSLKRAYKECIPFQLGRKTSFRTGTENKAGCVHQVMFTLVDGAIQAVIQSPGACGFRTTQMTFVPQHGSIAVSFNGRPEALYTRSLPENMFGAFQLVANSTLVDEANAVFRNFSREKNAILWTNLTSLWISRTPIHKVDEFLFKFAVSPNKILHRDYRLFNGTLLEFSGMDIVHLDSSRQQVMLGANSIVQEILMNRTLTIRYKFYPNYMLQTVEDNGEIKVVLTYSRTIPWHLHGTYEEVNEEDNEQHKKRRITISHDSISPTVVLEGLTSGTFRLRLNENESRRAPDDHTSRMTATNSTMHVSGGMGDVLSIVAPWVVQIPGRNEESLNQGEAASDQTKELEEIWTTLTPDADNSFGLIVDYEIVNTIQSSKRKIQQFEYRRVVQSALFGKFQFPGTDSVVQFIEGHEARFQYAAYGSTLNYTFDTPVEILTVDDSPYYQSPIVTKAMFMWHYVEMYGKVILTVYKTGSGSSDLTRMAAYVISPDGITLSEFLNGGEYELTRVV